MKNGCPHSRRKPAPTRAGHPCPLCFPGGTGSVPSDFFHFPFPISAGRAPARFALWPALADAWRGTRPAKDGQQEVHTATYRAAVWKDSGKLRELSVISADNGEVIRLVFR